MTMRVPTPPETVALIKAIVNLDLRERRRAGFIQCSSHLADRIAAELGLSIHTVRSIKERKRHKHAKASRLFWKNTVPVDRLERIRQQRLLSGKPVAPLDGFQPHWHQGSWSPRERIRRLAIRPGKPPRTP
jgi:hypothetical protein